MRAVSLHRDVIVVTSRVWQTTCTVVRGPAVDDAADGAPQETFVIDSPVYPDELEVLPALLEQAGMQFSGLLATHGDWDHLLGLLAFPDAALGCAKTTAERMTAEPGAPQRSLRAFDDEHYVARAQPLALSSVQALPVPGRCAIGAAELELHLTAGHTSDGMAVWTPWAGVLTVGDYLSAIEIPSFGFGGSRVQYLDTLERLRPLVAAAEYVVPGHGPVLDSARALAVLEEDVAYLRALGEHGEQAQLPPTRRSATQRKLHADNGARALDGD